MAARHRVLDVRLQPLQAELADRRALDRRFVEHADLAIAEGSQLGRHVLVLEERGFEQHLAQPDRAVGEPGGQPAAVVRVGQGGGLLVEQRQFLKQHAAVGNAWIDAEVPERPPAVDQLRGGDQELVHQHEPVHRSGGGHGRLTGCGRGDRRLQARAAHQRHHDGGKEHEHQEHRGYDADPADRDDRLGGDLRDPDAGPRLVRPPVSGEGRLTGGPNARGAGLFQRPSAAIASEAISLVIG